MPVEILPADGDVATFGGVNGHIEGEISGTNDDFVTVVALDEGQEFAEELASLVGVLYIFQLAAMTFFLIRMKDLSGMIDNVSTFQRR